MAERSDRSVCGLVLALLLTAALLQGCWNSSSLGRLFGAPPGGGGDGGFQPGIGGGLTLRDLFLGARLLRDRPKVLRTGPAAGAQAVSVKTPIVVEFSETMFENSVRTGVSLFQQGSATSTAVATTTFQADTFAVLVPQVDLLPNTQYEIVVAGAVVDLQGDGIEFSGGGNEQRFSFRTIESNGDPDFTVVLSSPAQQASEVTRGAEAVIVFSEPVNVSSSGGGLNAPGNVVVKRNGATLNLGTDYTLSTFPATNPRGLEIVFATSAPANAKTEVILDRSIQSADGQETLKGNSGFQLDFTAQNTAFPSDATFPKSPMVPGRDGGISSVDLHSYPADVSLTADGNLPDSMTIIYFDRVQQNALLFNKSATNPTQFISDLQPQTTPALLDGDVLVGCYVERRGFRSEVSVLKTLVKDTVGPRLVTMGPPSLNPAILVTQVNDPVMHGRMSEACAGVQVDFNGAGAPDFNSVQFAVGRSTVANGFFASGPTEDATIPQRLEPVPAFSFITSDLFGNLSVNADLITHVTEGKVGATVGTPDGSSALYVVAYAGDNYQQFVQGAAVLLDEFPPDPAAGTQIVKGAFASNGVVRFTVAELASIPTALVTVTVVAERALPSGGTVIFGPVTFAGLVKPSSASPRAVLALLQPEPVINVTSPVQCDIVNESNSSPSEAGSAFTTDVQTSTPTFDRFAPFSPNPGLADNVLALPLNRLHCFAVQEQFNFGGVQFRFAASDPFTAEPDPAGGFVKQRLVDFGGRASYSASTHPHLVHTVSFDDADVRNGGPVGLQGSEAASEQLRELRIVSRVPGFVENVGVAFTTSFTPSGSTRSGDVLLPQVFLDNDTPAGGVGFEDGPLELLIQPDLIDPAAVVDPARLQRNLRLELLVQDKLVTGTTTATSAYTRERRIFDPTMATSESVTFQAVPVVTPTSLVHPPALSWPEVTQGEGMHCLNLVSGIKVQTWRVYVPAQMGGGTVAIQLPSLNPLGGLPDGVGPLDFQLPGTFAVHVESYDLDPNHLFGPGSPEQYDFDPQSWFQSDLERECLRSSRSDPNFTIVTQ